MGNIRCDYRGSRLFPIPCEGSQWEAVAFYRDGGTLYACEAHAKACMRANPFGVRFTEAKERR